MQEWLCHRLLVAGSPVALQYLAYLYMKEHFPFPPLTFTILAFVLPSLTLRDYRRRHIVPICIIPASFAAAIMVLAVQCSIAQPKNPCAFHWFGFFLWVALLVINLLRKVEVFR